ncbi:DoxX family protein [Larkinella knui]
MSTKHLIHMVLDHKTDQGRHLAYWVITGLLVFGMEAGGFAQFFQARFNTDGFIHLGYPLYSMKIIGAWKIVGGVVLLLPGYVLLKEWAYAGFFFLLTGAVISHIASGDAFYQWVGPLVFALLTVWSWAIRPANRRIKAEFEPALRR